jgi:hypothetical protein
MESLQTMAESRAFVASDGKIEPRHFRDTNSRDTGLRFRFNQALMGKISQAFKPVANENSAISPF